MKELFNEDLYMIELDGWYLNYFNEQSYNFPDKEDEAIFWNVYPKENINMSSDKGFMEEILEKVKKAQGYKWDAETCEMVKASTKNAKIIKVNKTITLIKE